MKTKIIGIFIFMLLILVTIPNINSNMIKNKNLNNIQNLKFVPGEFIVKLTKDTTISNPSLMMLNEKYKVSSIEKAFKNSENTILNNIYILKIPEDSDILAVVNDYSSKTFIEYAEPNYIFFLTNIPNDEKFSLQWALYNTGETGGTPDADIDAPEAWDIETGDPDIVIAIIDTGIDYTHPDLSSNIWKNEDEISNNSIDDDNNGFIDDVIGWDFIGESPLFPEPDNDPLDMFGHGTHCAGLASAVTNNGIGTAGVCWNCKIMSIKIAGGFFGLINLISAVNGISYAIYNGADVISMSWGGDVESELLHNAIDNAYSNGIVLVSAAGNDNSYRKLYPAAYDNVIGVAATNKNDKKAWFSNYGDWVDVAAPGEQILSTLPTYHVTLNDLFYSMNYDYLDGTSMACPIVAGLAALLLSYDPSLDHDEVRSIIYNSTDWIETNKYIGNGRINVYKALLIASGVTVPPNKPSTPAGQINGKPGVEYNYTTIDIDPDGDDLYYLFSWDDKTYSGWVGPFASGATGNATHVWNKKGNYQIKVKARNSYGIESEWSDPLSVTMPRNKIVTNTFFLQLLEQFPLLSKLFSIISKTF